MNWHEDMHFNDAERNISGWGYLPTPEQQADRDAIFILELEALGFSFAEVLPTRSKRERVNWRYGDPNKYMETHWQMFEPGYASEEDEIIADQTINKIREYHQNYEEVFCVEPSYDMKFEARYVDDLPEGHGVVAIMVKNPKSEE